MENNREFDKVGVSRKDRRFEHKKKRNLTHTSLNRGYAPEDYYDIDDLEEELYEDDFH